MARNTYIKTGSGWEQIASTVLAVPQGLVPIVPTSFTGGTVSADGTITVSASSAVSLNTVFSSTYDNYLVTYDLTFSSGVQLSVRLRNSGTDNSSGLYDRGSVWNSSSTASASMATGQTSWNWGTRTFYRGQLIFSNPYLASFTTVMAPGLEYDTATPDIRAVMGQLGHRSASSFDGLTIYPASGTMTGTIKIYGYAKSSVFDPALSLTPRIELSRTTDFSVAHATYTQVTGWTQSVVRGGFSESGGTVTVPLTGRYAITFFGSWATNTTGSRVVGVAVNSDTSPTYPLSTVQAATIFTAQTATAYGIRLNSGDTLKPYVYQNSGGSLAFNATGFNGGHKFIVEYLGA